MADVALFFFFLIIGCKNFYDAYRSWLSVFYAVTNHRVLSARQFLNGDFRINESIDFLDLVKIELLTDWVDRAVDTGSVFFTTKSKSFEIQSIQEPDALTWVTTQLWKSVKEKSLRQQKNSQTSPAL